MQNFQSPPVYFDPPKRNYVGLLSLIFSFIVCFPPLQFAAFVMAIVALFSKRELVGGKIVAWLGLIVSSIVCFFFSWMIYAVVSVSPQARQVMSSFITNLEAGDEVAALAQCDSSVSAYSVTLWRTQAQTNAPVSIFQNIAFPMPANLGHGWGKSYIGAAQFKTATGMQMQYSFELIRVDDQFKVVRFIVPGFAPTTAPATTTYPPGGAGSYGGGSSGGTKARP